MTTPKYFIAEMKHGNTGKLYLRLLKQRQVGRIIKRIVVTTEQGNPIKGKFKRVGPFIEGRNEGRRVLSWMRSERRA